MTANQIAIIACDKQGLVNVFNPGAEALLDYTPASMLGNEIASIFETHLAMSDIDELLADGSLYESADWVYLKKSGEAVSVQLSITSIDDDDHNRVGYLFMASKDPSLHGHLHKPINLSTLPNSQTYEQTLDHECRRMQREENEIGVLKIDVDHFTKFQAAEGEKTAEHYLGSVAHLFEERLKRAGDFFAYTGLDEFRVILPNTDLPGSVKVAEQLRLLTDKFHKLTISVGLYNFVPSKNCDYALIEERVDGALQRAKKAGRNCTRIWE